MKNFINVRIQSTSHLKIRNRIKHNLRHVKSLNTIDETKKNLLIDLDSDKIVTLHKNNIKKIYSFYSNVYSKNRVDHNALYKKHNRRNVRDTFSSWGEGVITFSEALKRDLGSKYSLNDLIQCAKDTVHDISEHLGTNAINLIAHFDESTLHFHFFFQNYSRTGSSIVFENRTIDKLSPLQDIAFKHFGKLGMQRGKKKNPKDLGTYDYKTTKQWKAEQLYKQQEEISIAHSLLEDLNTNITNIQDQIQILTDQRDDLKVQREQVKNDLDLSKEEKKELYAQISQKQADIRDLIQQHRQTVKELKTDQKSFKNGAINDINTMLSNSKSLVGYDTKILKREMYALVKKYSSYDLKFKDYETLQSENLQLKNDNDQLTDSVQVQSIKMEELKRGGKYLLNTVKQQQSELETKEQQTIEYKNKWLDLQDNIKEFAKAHKLNFENWLEKSQKEYEIEF